LVSRWQDRCKWCMVTALQGLMSKYCTTVEPHHAYSNNEYEYLSWVLLVMII
jgi:hypothetical protein